MDDDDFDDYYDYLMILDDALNSKKNEIEKKMIFF